jgi:hypothetical protein
MCSLRSPAPHATPDQHHDCYGDYKNDHEIANVHGKQRTWLESQRFGLNQEVAGRIGAGAGGRTQTALRPRDFKSRASANSATPASERSDLYLSARPIGPAEADQYKGSRALGAKTIMHERSACVAPQSLDDLRRKN